YETVPELTDNTDLKTRIEALRLAAAQVMGLGDVADESYPKMTLVAAPRAGGAISTRSFIPHRVHESIGVLAAVTVATAVLLQGSVAAQLGTPGTGKQQSLGIEHPSGIFEALVDLDDDGTVVASGNTRTARLISRGEVYVPARIWDPSAPNTF
ncbi:MAG TPA: 4-oxalomesaconate tautomerase, partial [Enteractinococcus helveticum]